MGKRHPVILIGIDRDHTITPETDSEFLYALHRGLLLALREVEHLSDPQLHLAEGLLARQWGRSP